MDPMTIGQAAQRSGVPPKTIRYYESIGLVGPAARGENRYRTYSDKELDVLRFISRARGLGFSLSEIEQLLALYRDRNRPSREVKRLALRHIDDLERKIGELKIIKKALQHLAEKCRGDDRPYCPILEDLGSARSAPAAISPRGRRIPRSRSASIERQVSRS
jgi:MerR family copper efflux transcriptional regulator